MAALLLYNHSIALCTSVGDISVGARLIFGGVFKICVGIHWLFFLLRWPLLLPLCNMLTANDLEVVDCVREHAFLWPSIFP